MRADAWRSLHDLLRPYFASRVSYEFDRIPESPHADSALEEGQMKRCPGVLVIAVLLTFLNMAATVYSGVAVWNAWPGDIWDRGLLVLLAALGAASLVNVWVQALIGSVDSLGGRAIECREGATPIPAEARGSVNV